MRFVLDEDSFTRLSPVAPRILAYARENPVVATRRWRFLRGGSADEGVPTFAFFASPSSSGLGNDELQISASISSSGSCEIGHKLTEHRRPLITDPSAVNDPYTLCGAHPDAVMALWDEIGSGLPAKCRKLVNGMPALVHDQSNKILGFAGGSGYSLRVPAALAAHAMETTAETWLESGEEWVWVPGAWRPEERDWCRTAYARLS